MADLPDPNAPLTDWEKALLEKLFADPTQLPQKFKAWVSDYVANNGNFHIDNLPTLAGEEWREVGATGQPGFGTNVSNLGGGASTAAFYKDALGVVRLKGVVTKSSAWGINDTIFTLPEGYRPALNEEFEASAAEAGALGVSDSNSARVQVTSGGIVRFVRSMKAFAETDFISLVNISFRAA